MQQSAQIKQSWVHSLITKPYVLSILAVFIFIIVGVLTLIPVRAATAGAIVGIGGKCVDNTNNLKVGSNKIQLLDCNGGDSQTWTLQSNKTITNANGYCLDVQGAKKKKGTAVILWKCHGKSNQQWTVSGGTIVSVASKLCMDAQGAKSDNGTKIIVWTCKSSGNENQQWTMGAPTAPVPTPEPCDAATETCPTPAPSTTPTPTTPPAPIPGPLPTTSKIDKVLVFVEENHSLKSTKSGMPYSMQLANQYAYGSAFYGITHPSLGNYIAIAGGNAHGITDDKGPSSHKISGPSVFGQAIAKGKTAATYAEGMSGNCSASNSGKYAVKHNPWAYFTGESADCKNYNVPMTQFDGAVAAGKLPHVGMVVPDLCNDAHDCSLSTADNWFKARMAKVFAGPDWKSGRLAVILTFDEDHKDASNNILTVVIHPSQSKKVVSTKLTLYSLSRLMSEVSGSTGISSAASAASMTTAFGLPIGNTGLPATTAATVIPPVATVPSTSPIPSTSPSTTPQPTTSTPKPAPAPTTGPVITDASKPCSATTAPPAKYDHIIWISEENRALKEVIGNSNAPYITSLANQCGYSTQFKDKMPDSSFSGTGYHSLSQIIGQVAGSNCVSGNGGAGGKGSNCIQMGGMTSIPNIFSQLTAAGKTWKSYAESAPSGCSRTKKKPYHPDHDAVVYFTQLTTACKSLDVSIPGLKPGGTPSGALINDIKNNNLPNFAYITPNVDNDMHDLGPKQGDGWLKAYLTPLFQSATYKAGRTAVFVIWDEARADKDDILPNLVVAPTIHTGKISTVMNGYAILGLTQDNFGLQRLGCATGTPPGGVGSCYGGATANMRQIFGF